jgi:hypothetical protein
MNCCAILTRWHMRSNLDKLRYSFICRNPQCGRQFEKLLSRLVGCGRSSLPYLRAAINLYDSKLIRDKTRDARSQFWQGLVHDGHRRPWLQ